MILLDTLWPPAPDQLVRDCRAVGAAGCWVYAMRRARDGSNLGVGGWTAAHVDRMHAGDLVAPAIVVPGDVPPSPAAALAAARALHCDQVIAGDFEDFSEPPTSWEDQFQAAAEAAGWRELSYGPASELGLYDPGEPGWLARWVRTGQLDPIPSLPAGQLAWQFVNDVVINGTAYDVSVVDPALFEVEDMNAEQAQQLQRVYDVLETIPTQRAGGNAGDLVTNVYLQLRSADGASVPAGADSVLGRLLAAVEGLQAPQVDAGAVAAALAADRAFLAALGASVADVLWERLRPQDGTLTAGA